MVVHLFTDGSCDPHSKVGYGAALWVEDRERSELEALAGAIRARRFHPTSSSALELECLLWAFAELDSSVREVTVYTDSQTIAGLQARRAKLEAKGFCSAAGNPLSLGTLYRELFAAFDRIDCRVCKLEGHEAASRKTRSDQIFALVDRKARAALKSDIRGRS